MDESAYSPITVLDTRVPIFDWSFSSCAFVDPVRDHQTLHVWSTKEKCPQLIIETKWNHLRSTGENLLLWNNYLLYSPLEPSNILDIYDLNLKQVAQATDLSNKGSNVMSKVVLVEVLQSNPEEAQAVVFNKGLPGNYYVVQLSNPSFGTITKRGNLHPNGISEDPHRFSDTLLHEFSMAYHVEHRPYFTPSFAILMHPDDSAYDSNAWPSHFCFVSFNLDRDGEVHARLQLDTHAVDAFCHALDITDRGDIVAMISDVENSSHLSIWKRPEETFADVSPLCVFNFDQVFSMPGAIEIANQPTAWDDYHQIRICQPKRTGICYATFGKFRTRYVYGFKFSVDYTETNVLFSMEVDSAQLQLAVGLEYFVLGANRKDAVFIYDVQDGSLIRKINMPASKGTCKRGRSKRDINFVLMDDTSIMVYYKPHGYGAKMADFISFW